jgi:hypothetical protein
MSLEVPAKPVRHLCKNGVRCRAGKNGVANRSTLEPHACGYDGCDHKVCQACLAAGLLLNHQSAVHEQHAREANSLLVMLNAEDLQPAIDRLKAAKSLPTRASVNNRAGSCAGCSGSFGAVVYGDVHQRQLGYCCLCIEAATTQLTAWLNWAPT